MRILCVAEKPSAAKQIANILSQNHAQMSNTDDTYVKNYEFTYTLQQRSVSMVMTSVKGHLMDHDFNGNYKTWRLETVDQLFYAPIVSFVHENNRGVAQNLRRLARTADVVFIWTDCDREGEAIGSDVVDLCRAENPQLQVWRARFSTMQPAEIHQAARQPGELDMRQVYAVKVRNELDLRIGAAFTRLQTIQLRAFLDKVVSYGSCQFPTLGFVVDRYTAIQQFVPEKFWKIDMEYTEETDDPAKDEKSFTVKFHWKRNHLFDPWVAFAIYDMCYQNPLAKVTRVQRKEVKKRKPLPLTTVELQKAATRALRLSGAQIMTFAESLYTKGLISYPRTETDQFDPAFDFQTHIQKQVNDGRWGRYAQLIRDGEFERPRNGKNNDKAHPPIYPTGYDMNLSGNEARVYEFIVRRFLACCWKDAVGFETTVDVEIAGEEFDAKGLVIQQRNYLDVYPYDKWNSNYLPDFEEHNEFIPSSLMLNSGVTQPPQLLTEYDLISLMEKNEIGTDATIAEHIQKILDRVYAFKEEQHFHPSTLGIALVLGYDEIGFETSLSKPFLRREMEANLKAICQGAIPHEQVLRQGIERYKEMFDRTVREFWKIQNSMHQHYRYHEDEARTRSSRATIQNNQNNNNNESGAGTARGGSGRGGRGQSSTRSRGRGRRGSSTGRGRSSTSSSSSRRGNSRDSGANRVPPPPTTTTNNANTNAEIPNCRCNQPCMRLTVTRNSANYGRPFFRCANQNDNEGCDFFAWADESS